MTLRILIAPDKFKGSLTAHQVAEAIAGGWRKGRPGDVIEVLPISDGGDGFGSIVAGLRGARVLEADCVDAAQRPVLARWWWEQTEQRAIVEAAQANGLAQLPKNQFHPFQLDTRGLGLLMRACGAKAPRSCLMGIGGSATNDGGFGMARALGWRFLDGEKNEILSWLDLVRLESMIPPASPVSLGEVVVAVDVQNPLLGQDGCTRCYGPQKGLLPQEFTKAEEALGRLAGEVEKALGQRVHELAGAGAAGGLGFGLVAFAGATLTSGFELFAELGGLRERIRSSDLVITGEGRVDATSLMGKGAGGLAKICGELGKPCAILAGSMQDPASFEGVFRTVRALVPHQTTMEEALREPAAHLEAMAAGLARAWA